MDEDCEPEAGLARRLLGLDLLRLVAILLVLGRHADDAPDSIVPAWQAFFDAWKRGGWVGVDLFFVLSGFLVSGLLFAEYKKCGTMGIGRFYVRRGFKIYPAFLVLIAATVGYELLDGDRVDPRRVLAEAAFMQNYFDGLWWHSWSLDVEEHFYLALPLVLTAILAWRRDAADPFKPLLAMIVAVLVACLAMRIATWRAHPQVDIRVHIHPTHLRLDSLFFGVGLGYAYHMHPQRFAAAARWRWQLIAAGVGVLAIPFGIELESSGFLEPVTNLRFAS